MDIHNISAYQSWGTSVLAKGLCDIWDRPWYERTARSPGSEHPVSTRMLPSTDDLPYLLTNPKESNWASPHSRIWIQTDNQQIVEISAGRSVLSNDSRRPVGVQISRSLFRFLKRGWKPRSDISDLTEWDPREIYTIAGRPCSQQSC